MAFLYVYFIFSPTLLTGDLSAGIIGGCKKQERDTSPVARIRTIKPDFFRHEGLFALEQESGLPIRIAFAGLWTVADREGRFKWRPRELKLDCLPYDNIDFADVLTILAEAGYLGIYEVNGEFYGYIPSWSKHQCINMREAASTIPAPDEYSARMCTHVQARGEGKGREGNRKGIKPPLSPLEGEPTKVIHNQETKIEVMKNETPKRSAKKQLTPFPDNLDEGTVVQWLTFAAGLGLSYEQCDAELAKFRDWAVGKGERKADWLAAWRNWVRRVVENNGPRAGGQGGGGRVSTAAIADAVVAKHSRQGNGDGGDLC